MKVSVIALLVIAAVALGGCEAEPVLEEPVGEAPEGREMFEYQSKPVGDPSAVPYRPEHTATGVITVPAEQDEVDEIAE